jgi:hypothetical protein
MMKFGDIKVGDSVLVKTNIVLGGWNRSGKAFYVRRKVIRVTPKQFEVEFLRNKLRKEDGSPVGDGSHAYMLGEEIIKWGNAKEVVKDETDDAVEYEKLVNKYNKFISLTSDIELDGRILEKFKNEIETALTSVEKIYKAK